MRGKNLREQARGKQKIHSSAALLEGWEGLQEHVKHCRHPGMPEMGNKTALYEVQ